MTTRNITIAFAGPGEVKKQAVQSLLDDWLGFGPQDADGYPEPSEHEVHVVFPVSSASFSKGLQTVIDWTEYADLPYDVVLSKGDRDDSIEHVVSDAENVSEVVNIEKATIDLLKDAEGEKYLVLLWGEDGDEQTEILLDLASAEGIPAKDLTDGLDDITFDDGGEPEPEAAPEPEPEEKKPARGRRGRRGRSSEEAAEPEEKPARGRRSKSEPEQPLEDDEKPLEEDAPGEPEVEEKPKRGRKSPAKVETEKVPLAKDVKPTPAAAAAPETAAATVDVEYHSGVLQSVLLHLQHVDQSNAMLTLSEPQESPLTAVVREALEALHLQQGTAPTPEDEKAPEAAAEAPKRGRGRPRKTPVEEETTGYLLNEDGIYRKAGRGRPRRGEEKVDLTKAQVADLEEQGLIADED